MQDRGRRPNVVIVLLDDCGFAQLGCFGSEMQTPNIDALAEDGLRFNAYHVTALCSPTRACLLTGRNHHAVGMGLFPEVPGASPGYSGRLPDGVWTLPRALRDSGYSTFAVGKWHITPLGERSAAGPFTRGGRSGWASSATTASSARRPTSGRRRWWPTTTPSRLAERRRRLPPQRGPRQPGDQDDPRPAPGEPRPPVLPVLRDGRPARPAPRRARVERPLPRPVRRRLGRHA